MGVTLKFQSSGTVPGNARPIAMEGGSLTVGRGPANDLVLPDPERQLSKNHFVIEDHNGNVMIVDLSTNGTFLNYSKIPLGRTPTPLNNGDVLALGSYELVVQIADERPDFEDMIAPPAEADPISHGRADASPDPMRLLEDSGPEGDFLDDLLGPDKAPTGPKQLNPVDPIDELLPPAGEEEDPFFRKSSDGREGEGASVPMHNPSVSDSFRPQGSGSGNLIPDDWDDDFLSPSKPKEPPAPLAAEEDATPEPLEPKTVLPDRARRAPPEPKGPEETRLPTGAQADGAAMVRAFLKGAGAEDVRLSDDEMATTMARMGRVMRTFVTGLREILMTRTTIKSEFRIEQTQIGAGANNPLKFSISPEQAVEAMVKPATKGYLGAESAAEQALQDIKAHEVAMVTGMEAALKGVLSRLDPAKLASRIEDRGAFDKLLGNRKARYWEVYEKMYAEISDQAENDFHDLFSREFARAYKEQLDKLKP